MRSDRVALVQRQPDRIEQRIDAEDDHQREAGKSQGNGCSEVNQRGSQERPGRRRVIDGRGHATAPQECAANPACPTRASHSANQALKFCNLWRNKSSRCSIMAAGLALSTGVLGLSESDFVIPAIARMTGYFFAFLAGLLLLRRIAAGRRDDGQGDRPFRVRPSACRRT